MAVKPRKFRKERTASGTLQAATALNEALILGSVRQHELTEAAENVSDKLRVEMAERQQAEMALRASEERFRTLFDLGPVAIYSCNASGVIQNFNRRAVELWGRTPVLNRERFCGSLKLFNPDGRFIAHNRCPMADVLSGKLAGVRDKEMLIERTDGTRISVLVNIRALKEHAGKITGAINCFSNITELKRIEDALLRNAVLTSTNRKLELEIAQRRAAEKSLKKSKLHKTRLLRESKLMQTHMQLLSHQLLMAQEEERKRISRELHDVIGQTLTGINLQLAALKREAAVESTGIKQSIARTQQMVEESVDIVHEFARALRPTVLDDLGLIPALQAYLKRFKTETGTHVSLSAYAAVEQEVGDKRIVFYRVIQESLTNIARHAQAGKVEVSIQKLEDAICVTIKDDGKGFYAEHVFDASKNKRLGLVGMRERMEMVGGTFTVDSSPGKGTRIMAAIPRGKLRTKSNYARSVSNVGSAKTKTLAH